MRYKLKPTDNNGTDAGCSGCAFLGHCTAISKTTQGLSCTDNSKNRNQEGRYFVFVQQEIAIPTNVKVL